MAKKTKKDLEEEVSKVKNEFNELKLSYDTLSKKYESLCKPPVTKCEKCDKEFASDKELRMHRNINVVSVRKVTKVKN